MATMWADAGTMSQLFAATTDAAKRTIVDSRLGDGTLTATVRNGAGSTVLTGTFSGSLFTTGAIAMSSVELAGETGAGGTPDNTWSLRIENVGGQYIQFPKSTWTFSGPSGSGVIASTDNQFITLTLGGAGAYIPSVPPTQVMTWIHQPGVPVVVPSSLLGIHSDYVAGVTYPSDPGATLMSKFGTVRSQDHYPNNVTGITLGLSWPAIEQSAGAYTWTHLDNWVAQHTGKLLIYIVNLCPTFYAKYSTSYNIYGSFINGASPPSDWTKLADFLLALRARYPDENWIFEIWNEPLFGWTTGTGAQITADNMYDTRADDAFLQRVGITWGGFFIGTARDLADGVKVLKTAGVYPLMGIACEGDDTDSPYVNDFRRVMTCPTSGGGVGADQFDLWSFHSYTYDNNGTKLVQEGLSYKALAATLGLGGKAFHLSEIGFESNDGTVSDYAYSMSDEYHSTNVIRWAYIAAALGCRSLCYYKLASATTPSGGEAKQLKWYGTASTAQKIASNTALVNAMTTANAICGKTIGQAALLSDGTVWVEFTDNTQVRQ